MLYSIVAMHHTELYISRSKSAWLQAGMKENRLIVWGAVTRDHKGAVVYISHEIYHTDLLCEVFSDPAIISPDHVIHIPIEIGEGPRLIAISPQS